MDKETQEVVRRFLEGDRQAFTEIFRRYKKRIYSVAYRMLGNHLDADEVTQETFVRIYKKRQELKTVAHFSSYIWCVATNYCIDISRKQKRLISVDDLAVLKEVHDISADKSINPDRSLENMEIGLEIKKAIDELPPKQKMTIILHDIEGLSKREIAYALGCPQATVRSNLHIARSKLKKSLGKKLM
jgi:RNA polymerase sigma-70 factor (ECF subfamily)